MLVKNWMSKPAITINADATIKHAIDLLKYHEIRMLPVMEDNQLVGVVTDRDLKRASASDLTDMEIHEFIDLIAQTTVKKAMTKQPITVSDVYTVEETAETLLVHNISGVPVVNQMGEIVGVITKTDLFKMFISLTGAGNEGVQFALKLTDQPGAIKEVTDIIRDYGARIVSMLSTRGWAENGCLNVYIRAYGVDKPTLERIKEVIKETASILYIVDYEEKTRVIYPVPKIRHYEL